MVDGNWSVTPYLGRVLAGHTHNTVRVFKAGSAAAAGAGAAGAAAIAAATATAAIAAIAAIAAAAAASFTYTSSAVFGVFGGFVQIFCFAILVVLNVCTWFIRLPLQRAHSFPTFPQLLANCSDIARL